jgi:5-(aminomethyl)-3-furanmethanol phosphate kinase
VNNLPIILKLGGSLLTCPDLVGRLWGALEALQASRVLIVAGGGGGADLIARLQDRFSFSDEAAHWAAISAMSDNAAMLARLAPFLRLVTNREEAAAAWADRRTAVLDAWAFLQTEEGRSGDARLPQTWDVTSDSIALWTAVRWPAARLILAKSCSPSSTSVRELVAGGSIDRWFTHVSGSCPVEWLNLRSETVDFVPLHFSSPPTTGSPS